jgi:hypothetical protein
MFRKVFWFTVVCLVATQTFAQAQNNKNKTQSGQIKAPVLKTFSAGNLRMIQFAWKPWSAVNTVIGNEGKYFRVPVATDPNEPAVDTIWLNIDFRGKGEMMFATSNEKAQEDKSLAETKNPETFEYRIYDPSRPHTFPINAPCNLYFKFGGQVLGLRIAEIKDKLMIGEWMLYHPQTLAKK